MPGPTAVEPKSSAPYLYLLTTMLLFGSAFASSKVVVGDLPHQVAAALRFGGGAVILLVVAAVLRDRTRSFSRRDAVRAGFVGLLGVFGYNLFFFWGLSLAPSIDGSVIVPVLSPVLTTTALLLSGREEASGPRVVGLALGVVGAVVFFIGVGGVGAVADSSRLAGDVVFLLGAACWAAYSIASKKVLVGMDPLQATTCATGVGSAALLIVAAPSLITTDWTSVSGTAWANLVYLAIGPTAVAYLFYYHGLRTVSPSTATVMMFSVPVFGTACAAVFLGESFTPIQLMGAVVMLVGAVLAVARWPRRARGAESKAVG
ncbi:MAG: DMT family transporter [Pseudonocardia sp.]